MKTYWSDALDMRVIEIPGFRKLQEQIEEILFDIDSKFRNKIYNDHPFDEYRDLLNSYCFLTELANNDDLVNQLFKIVLENFHTRMINNLIFLSKKHHEHNESMFRFFDSLDIKEERNWGRI